MWDRGFQALVALDWVLPLLYLAKRLGDDCYEATGTRLQHIPLLHGVISFLQKMLIRRSGSGLVLTTCLTERQVYAFGSLQAT